MRISVCKEPDLGEMWNCKLFNRRSNSRPFAENKKKEIMKFKEYDTVRIMKDYNEDIKRGTIGVILMAFEEPREAYEVEILDEKGNPKAQCIFFQMNWNRKLLSVF